MSAPTEDRAGVSDLSLDEIVRREAFERDRAAAESHTDDPLDDTITLPWWQHPVNIVTFIVTALLIAGMIGWMVGANSRVGHNEVDTGFLQDMREHHEQAVLMGFIFRGLPDTDPGLRTVSASIVRGQSIEVGRMIQLLRDFDEAEANDGDTSMNWMGMSADPGSMPGMASEAELDELGQSSGREADRLFVELMTAHHLGGIDMAEFAAENGQNDEVRLMAESMAAAQRGEIVEMEGQLG